VIASSARSSSSPPATIRTRGDHRRQRDRPTVIPWRPAFGYSHLTGGYPAARPSTCACRMPTSGRS
jgi:hypothetical protein